MNGDRMNGDRPDWYSRAAKGPFDRQPFDDRLRREIEARIAGRGGGHTARRRSYGPAAWFAGAALLALGIALLFVHLYAAAPGNGPSGGNAVADGSGNEGAGGAVQGGVAGGGSGADHDGGPGPGPAGGTAETGESVNPPGTVRAEGKTESGRLLFISKGDESQETLGAPSCYGAETDIRYHGDYRVVYEAGGKRSDIGSLDNLDFIQPKEGVVELAGMPFPDAEVFLLVPDYKDCHGLTVHAYAVAGGDSGAFPLSFRTTADGTADNSYYRPGVLPSINNGLLVLPSSEGPGGETAEGAQDRYFKLDLQAKTFVQTEPDETAGGSKFYKPFEFADGIYTIGYSVKKLVYYPKAAELEDGIVWSPVPEMAGLDSKQDMDIHPVKPFVLYFSKRTKEIAGSGSPDGGRTARTELTADNAQKLITLPLMDGDDYVYLEDLYGAGDYIVFSTYSKKPGMVQAVRDRLWALDRSAPGTAKPIADFHVAGGYQFTLGIQSDEGDVIAIQSTPNGDGDYDREPLVYNLKTGKSYAPDTFSETADGIEYEKDGRMYTAARVY